MSLYLLDTDIDDNTWEDRSITHQLYGGDNENRLRQELLLGVGGLRVLKALGISPDIYHLNEGHAAMLHQESIAHEAHRPIARVDMLHDRTRGDIRQRDRERQKRRAGRIADGHRNSGQVQRDASHQSHYEHRRGEALHKRLIQAVTHQQIDGAGDEDGDGGAGDDGGAAPTGGGTVADGRLGGSGAVGVATAGETARLRRKL